MARIAMRSAVPAHILITGASSGIGAALARCYAGPGVRLSLIARNPERLEYVAQECRALGSETFCGACSVCDADAMRTCIEEVDGAHPVAMAIANAGIGGERVIAGPSGETAEVAREIFETNVLGVANTVIPLVPRFAGRGEGHIVIMSSLAAFVALPDAPVYSASKAAVRVYGQALRRLLESRNVRVTVVCPGFVETPMSASLSGPRPLLWSAARAADAIVAGLARNRREICFPWQLSALAKLGACLPAAFVDRVVERMGSRPR